MTIDVTGCLLYSLFQNHWQEVELGYMVDGSVLELEFTQAPKICRLYDGYLTVVAEGRHMHLCLEENRLYRILYVNVHRKHFGVM